MKKTVKELAEEAFEASERVRALSMMNTPTDYDERKKAFVELIQASRAEIRTHGALAATDGAKEERKRCAEIAERVGRELGEPTIGHAIAQAIRSEQ